MNNAIPTRPALRLRIRRFLVLLRCRVLLGQAACIRAEREFYEDAGAVGPIYRRNSFEQELQLLAQVRELKQST